MEFLVDSKGKENGRNEKRNINVASEVIEEWTETTYFQLCSSELGRPGICLRIVTGFALTGEKDASELVVKMCGSG